MGFEIVSTGGTAKALREAGLQVTDVSSVTGHPEMLDGRVKTLHPAVHAGLLADTNDADHVRQMAEAGYVPIEVVAVNLYAFEKTVTGPHDRRQAIESIDIGGPAMVRASAKNHDSVTVVVDPADYPAVLAALSDGSLAELRPALAAKAFRHTAHYDSIVARYLTAATDGPDLPETLTIGWRRATELRYGENPHQAAALYLDPLGEPGLAQARQLWGKELSYNNLLDADAAWELACDLPEAACAVIKHGNPCGAAALGNLAESYRAARAADTVSAFGGIAALNGTVDEAAALAMTEKGNFLEVVVGAGWTDAARQVFAERSGWGQDVRLLESTKPPSSQTLALRQIRGGILAQQSDEEPQANWRVASRREPSPAEWEALRFAWTVVKHVKSNAIVIAAPGRLLGVGAGQMNRVQSVRLALEQAGDGARGAALASDAFFPFPDSIETAAAAGITAVVQPGGSKKDPEVLARADELGLAVVLTGVRHFRH
jgi:phosphoribosylaminoimidazolecarboxamide formyltransferase / IMP cyclohydrolase